MAGGSELPRVPPPTCPRRRHGSCCARCGATTAPPPARASVRASPEIYGLFCLTGTIEGGRPELLRVAAGHLTYLARLCCVVCVVHHAPTHSVLLTLFYRVRGSAARHPHVQEPPRGGGRVCTGLQEQRQRIRRGQSARPSVRSSPCTAVSGGLFRTTAAGGDTGMATM
eukprot:COSAG01_NODE_1821_length_9119_cov_4.375345_11_plen_169_part_00